MREREKIERSKALKCTNKHISDVISIIERENYAGWFYIFCWQKNCYMNFNVAQIIEYIK